MIGLGLYTCQDRLPARAQARLHTLTRKPSGKLARYMPPASPSPRFEPRMERHMG